LEGEDLTRLGDALHPHSPSASADRRRFLRLTEVSLFFDASRGSDKHARPLRGDICISDRLSRRISRHGNVGMLDSASRGERPATGCQCASPAKDRTNANEYSAWRLAIVLRKEAAKSAPVQTRTRQTDSHHASSAMVAADPNTARAPPGGYGRDFSIRRTRIQREDTSREPSELRPWILAHLRRRFDDLDPPETAADGSRRAEKRSVDHS
jgi:hypothetical protein